MESTGDNLTDFSSTDAGAVQAAVEAASPGDTLKIAGTCAGVQTVNSSDQIAWLDQSLAMQGGYTTTNWLVEPDSDLYPTILDAENSGRVLLIDSGSITLSHLILTNGTSPGNGGGIFNGGSLVISQSVLSNHSAQYGGAIYNKSNAALTATNSTFTANTADDDPASDDSYGGAINSRIDATLLLKRNTFSNNRADRGGAVATSGGNAILINNTIYSNTGRYAGGGLYLNGGFSRIEYNTIAANQTGAGDTNNNEGGGVRQVNGFGFNFVFIQYNIFDNNSDLDCRGSGSFQVDYNVLTAENGCSSDTNIIADPQLGPLADNGGDTQTMEITADSPAYNPDDSPDFRFCPAIDQRGYTRPQGPGCDLGAFEVDYVDIGLELTVQPTYPQPGDPITYTITFSNNSSSETVTGVALTDTFSSGILSTSVQTAPETGVVMTYTPASTYAWTISDLGPGQGGVITLSGQVDDSLGVGAVISNTATITGSEDAANDTNNSQTLISTMCYGTAITVTTAADSGPGSLRQAIVDLCEGGVITFDNDYTIHLSSTLTLDRSGVTIDGSGHTITLSGDSGGDGSRDVRVLVISSTGVVTLNHTNIVSGYATGATDDGGGILNEGRVTLIGSALFDNAATGSIGGMRNNGVAILRNSTVTGNSDAGIGNRDTLTATHVTIANNDIGLSEFQSELFLRNSILADNTTQNCKLVESFIIENISNLIEGGDCNSGTTLSGFLSDDPLLGTPDYHGGTTLNYSLLPGSPAIGTGDQSYCATLDQRGSERMPYDSRCDRGAHEADGANPTLSKSVSSALITTGQVVTYTLTITNAGNETATSVVITDLVPAEFDADADISSSDLTLTPIGGTGYAWTAGDLAAGQSGVITISGPMIGGGTVTNTASISSSNDMGVFQMSRSRIKLPKGVDDSVLNCWS